MSTETTVNQERTQHLVEEYESRYRDHARTTMDGEERLRRLVGECKRRYNCDEILVRAPGRVNLIGEHTDYNDGFVLPIAIDYDIRFAVTPRSDRQVRIYSLDFDAETVLDLDQIERDERDLWSNYIRGMADEMIKAGCLLRGMEGVVEGNIPQGAGLSSSAAMEIAAGLAFCAVSQQVVDPPLLAQLAQKAENNFVGVRCGIMDQFISRMGHQDHALFLDCRSLEYELIPVPSGDCVFVVTNSREGRELAASAYNERRAQCEAAVAALKGVVPDLQALRDVSLPELRQHEKLMEPLVYRRARHVVTENERVLQAVEALRKEDLHQFGDLMDLSHDSLRDDYEVSSPALDLLVEAARAVDGCLGSRLTGAGFGGCTVSLVRREVLPAFQEHVSRVYREKTGKEAEFYVTRPAPGAGPIAPPS